MFWHHRWSVSASVRDRTAHGYFSTGRKAVGAVGATWRSAGMPPSHAASMRAKAGASVTYRVSRLPTDISAVVYNYVRSTLPYTGFGRMAIGYLFVVRFSMSAKSPMRSSTWFSPHVLVLFSNFARNMSETMNPSAVGLCIGKRALDPRDADVPLTGASHNYLHRFSIFHQRHSLRVVLGVRNK